MWRDAWMAEVHVIVTELMFSWSEISASGMQLVIVKYGRISLHECVLQTGVAHLFCFSFQAVSSLPWSSDGCDGEDRQRKTMSLCKRNTITRTGHHLKWNYLWRRTFFGKFRCWGHRSDIMWRADICRQLQKRGETTCWQASSWY